MDKFMTVTVWLMLVFGVLAGLHVIKEINDADIKGTVKMLVDEAEGRVKNEMKPEF